eukprot:gene35639-47926_t
MRLRAGEVGEGLADAAKADAPGDQRRDVDPPGGDMRQGGGELARAVAEHELHRQLLDDTEERLAAVGLHADADDDDARAGRRALEHLLHHARHADAFEQHGGPPARAGAGKLGEAGGVEAGGRDPREFTFPSGTQEGYVVAGGQEPRPELIISPTASSFDASYPQLLLDRYPSGTGLNYNEDAPVFELPRGPLLSLGSLQHLFLPGQRPFAVGNSWGGDRNAWFDQYFFSGLTPETLWTDVTKPLPNPQLRVVRRKADGNNVIVDDLNGVDRQADGLSAKHLLQHGSFNLNSVSAPAWAAVLRGVRFTAANNFTFLNASTGTGTAADSTTTLPEPFLTNSRLAGFPRFAQSAQEVFKADDGYLQSDPGST